MEKRQNVLQHWKKDLQLPVCFREVLQMKKLNLEMRHMMQYGCFLSLFRCLYRHFPKLMELCLAYRFLQKNWHRCFEGSQFAWILIKDISLFRIIKRVFVIISSISRKNCGSMMQHCSAVTVMRSKHICCADWSRDLVVERLHLLRLMKLQMHIWKNWRLFIRFWTRTEQKKPMRCSANLYRACLIRELFLLYSWQEKGSKITGIRSHCECFAMEEEHLSEIICTAKELAILHTENCICI